MVLLLVKLQKIPPLLGHWGRIIDVLYDNVGDLLLLHTYDGPTQFIYIHIYISLAVPRLALPCATSFRNVLHYVLPHATSRTVVAGTHIKNGRKS